MNTYSLNTNVRLVISIQKTSIHLKELRIKHNLTRYQLADALQCSYQAIANWEDKNDKKIPALDKLVTMSVLYNCHIEDLLIIDNYKIPFSEIHEDILPYGNNTKLVSHPSEFKNFINQKVILESGEIANGFYITSSYSLHFINGFLSDKYNKSGKLVSPAVYSTDNKHFEHWKNGVFHFEEGPAVIDGLEHYEEWWINGKQVKPRK